MVENIDSKHGKYMLTRLHADFFWHIWHFSKSLPDLGWKWPWKLKKWLISYFFKFRGYAMALNTNIPYYKIFLNGNKYLHHTSPRQFPTYLTWRNCRKMVEKSEDVGRCRKMLENVGKCRKCVGKVPEMSGWSLGGGPLWIVDFFSIYRSIERKCYS